MQRTKSKSLHTVRSKSTLANYKFHTTHKDIQSNLYMNKFIHLTISLSKNIPTMGATNKQKRAAAKRKK